VEKAWEHSKVRGLSTICPWAIDRFQGRCAIN
jgi:hypothetical protein